MFFAILGILLSIAYAQVILPRNTGEKPKLSLTIWPFFYQGMVIVPMSHEKAVHIHHWIIYALFLLLLYNKLNTCLRFFCFGLMVQGLMYKDAFCLLEKNPYTLLEDPVDGEADVEAPVCGEPKDVKADSGCDSRLISPYPQKSKRALKTNEASS